MTARPLFAFLAVALLAAPAGAQMAKGAGKLLKGKELEKALLGVDMEGFSPSGNEPWRECIQPDGETLYETPDRVLKGKLDISPDSRACYSYNDDDYSTVTCFWTYRQGQGLRFEADHKDFKGEPTSLFVTTRVVTGVTSCKPKSLTS